MKKTILISLLFIGLLYSNSIKSQTLNKEEIYPFTKLSISKDTLFILNTTVGLCVTEVWETKPTNGKSPLLVVSDDIDYFLDKKKNCEKIVKTIKIN